MQIKTKNVSCHTADSKTVKQEVNGTMILPPLVFPVTTIVIHATAAWTQMFIWTDRNVSKMERAEPGKWKLSRKFGYSRKCFERDVYEMIGVIFSIFKSGGTVFAIFALYG